jgi:D-amino peptidase
MKSMMAVGTALLLTVSAASAQQRPLKVLVLYDMEGLSGENDWRMTTTSYPDLYAKGRQMLLGDVNAVIAGLFEGGATAVDVTDGHGSGNQEPDIPLDQMDGRAKMVFRDKPFDPYTDLVEKDVYDAVVNVGMHAKPGSRGFLAHTYTGGVESYVNGHMVTEPELIAYSWGRVNVPVIMVTGDDKLKEDLAKPMPWIEYVVVKKSLSASDAELLPLEDVHLNMKASAKRAVQNLSKMKSVTISGPVKAMVKARPPGSLTILNGVPGVNYSDNSVSFTSPDFITAYKGIIALIRVTGTGRTPLMMETLNQQPYGRQAMMAFGEANMKRWLEFEMGTWTPPPPMPPELQPARKYFGSN